MTLQAKAFETAAEIRARASHLAASAITTARLRAGRAVERLDSLKPSLTALQLAGREFGKVARRHVSRFVTENAGLARDAGKDVTALARSTLSKLAKREAAPARQARKTATARKRVVTAKRVRASAKQA